MERVWQLRPCSLKIILILASAFKNLSESPTELSDSPRDGSVIFRVMGISHYYCCCTKLYMNLGSGKLKQFS